LDDSLYAGFKLFGKGIKRMEEMEKIENNFKIVLSLDEKIKCLEELVVRLKKILYVYDRSLEPDSKYNYRIYCGGVAMYISSSNYLFNGELVSVVVNMTSILNNKLEKTQIKKLVFDSVNYVEFLLSSYKDKKESDKE
jgi:hypothetical protein